MSPSAFHSRSEFSISQLMRARTKPAWCSSVRWMMELKRRAATGTARGRRTDIHEQATAAKE